MVVRNSRLEDAHANGPVDNGGLQGITSMAVGPLSHLLAARRRRPVPVDADHPFAELAAKYPRAWVCLTTLADTITQGGRTGYRRPEAPVPDLPSAEEHAEATFSEAYKEQVVFSGIDPRFDHHMIDTLRTVAGQQIPLFVSTLSRVSRNTDKLLRVIEFLLAQKATILTTNYMLRPHNVWVRRGAWSSPTTETRTRPFETHKDSVAPTVRSRTRSSKTKK